MTASRSTIYSSFFLVFTLFFLVLSCNTEDRQENTLVKNEYSQIFEPIPNEAEGPEDNPMTEEKIDLGHMLFFENRLSRSGIISCNSCHVVGAAGVDHRVIAMGDSGRVGPRNSPNVCRHFSNFASCSAFALAVPNFVRASIIPWRFFQ